MKSVLILILSAALLAAAHFTRPGERDFRKFVKNREASDRSLAGQMASTSASAEQFLKDYAFKDRWLYVQVERNGRTLFTGAFDRWYDHSDPSISGRQPRSR